MLVLKLTRMEEVNIKVILDPKSILVINHKGRLRKLYCPFRVVSLKAVGHIPIDSFCYVESVMADNRDLILYQIGENYFPHSNFQIIISF